MKKRTIALLAASAAAMTLLHVPMTGVQLENQQLVQMADIEEETVPVSGMDFTKEMKIGWNLGNTFDAPAGETSWGNPMTSKELLVLVKELGFETIRIPISWRMHVSDAPEYTIDEKFMNRVDTVVNQALEAGLHVIINSHHDNEVYSPTPENSEKGQEYLSAIWTQIAEHFKDADYNLVFQTMNEPRVVGTSYEWSLNPSNLNSVAAVRVVNDLNQAALNAIRATGGNNADRFVIISPYAGNVGAATSSYFKLPEDTAEDRLIVSIHAYTPYNLALDTRSSQTTFGKKQESEIRSFLKSVNYIFTKNGIPVIIDEMGCLNKDNPEDRYAWGKAYVAAAAEYGIPCVWWDNGSISGSGENFGLINRRKLTVYDQSKRAYEGLMEGLTTAD